MAEHPSVKKRHKQSLKANEKNHAVKSRIKSATRQLIADAGKPESASQMPALTSLLDKAVKGNVLHKKTVARKKSRLAKMLNKKQASK